MMIPGAVEHRRVGTASLPTVESRKVIFNGPRVWLGLCGLLFIASAAGKVIHFRPFVDALAGYRLLPDKILALAGVALILVESVVGVGLLFRRTQRACARAGAVLLVFFSVVVAVTLANRLYINCGCSLLFQADSPISGFQVARNAVLAAFMGALILASEGGWARILASVRQLRSRGSHVLAVGLFLGMGATIIHLKQRNSLLVERFSPPARLKAGDTVGPFAATGTDGRKRRISYDESTPTVLFALSPKCPHCKTILPTWNREYEEKKDSARYLGVMVMGREEEATAFLREHEVRFPVCFPDDPGSFSKEYKLFAVPQKLDIGPRGKILSVSAGPPRETAKHGLHGDASLDEGQGSRRRRGE